MRLKDVPPAAAYLVWHDAFDNGAMDVYPSPSFQEAQSKADQRNRLNEEQGQDESGGWKAYEKLPRIRIFKYHGGVQ